jgi:hypothetical protein
MRLPVIHGVIKRRLLVNFRVEPEVMRRWLPSPFRPKLHAGHAIAGVCLIRLEQIRPRGFPAFLGIASENAAHRVAVEWDGPDGDIREGVYIPRRDTNSILNQLAGGRIFPGEHHAANFRVVDRDGRVEIAIQTRDRSMSLDLHARESSQWPTSSCFASLAESSAFFESGSVGYSATRDCCRLDGLQLHTDVWQVQPLAVERVCSSFFDDRHTFPDGTVMFDHALLMRDVSHQWHQLPDLVS